MGTTDYVVTYSNLLKSLDLRPEDLHGVVKIEANKLVSMLKHLLRGVHVDEEWYRERYDDVDEAIKKGTYESSKHHFVEDGYFEGRRPRPVEVDEVWYVTAYPDVAEGLELGDIQSAQQHFDEYGHQEGRLPSAY